MALKGSKGKRAISSFPRRRRGNNYGLYRLVNAVGIFIIIGLLVIIVAQHVRQVRVKQELAGYESQIVEYEKRKEAAETEVERLQDLDYIEGLARNRLGLVKPGEIIFQIED